MPRPSPVQLLFSPEGRLARAPFLLLTGAFVGLLALSDYGLPTAPWRPLVSGLLSATVFVAGACAISKRLHDRGRSGWWWAAPLLAFTLAWPRPHGWLGWAACAVVALAALELGLRPGERGFNRYGPPPR